MRRATARVRLGALRAAAARRREARAQLADLPRASAGFDDFELGFDDLEVGFELRVAFMRT